MIKRPKCKCTVIDPEGDAMARMEGEDDPECDQGHIIRDKYGRIPLKDVGNLNPGDRDYCDKIDRHPHPNNTYCEGCSRKIKVNDLSDSKIRALNWGHGGYMCKKCRYNIVPIDWINSTTKQERTEQ